MPLRTLLAREVIFFSGKTHFLLSYVIICKISLCNRLSNSIMIV